MIKLYQNYFSYENTNPPINKGDLVYSHSRKRVFQVKGKGSIGLSLNYKFPKGNEKNGGNFIIEGHKFYKINPNLSNGRNTSNNIENYVSFLKTFFWEKKIPLHYGF
ncbi:hypothetical protein CCAN11_2390002 [Capnocytophaga canimorsus]|uniref:Uncharacterized protein n=1 Tax=Capnocytophaga canimorsus TaxID=28188 RepID=A0A0B7IJI0_9FLAO|nr:hypothetical protein CCAN11_2390002 [Capnocytophaga canimorsus]